MDVKLYVWKSEYGYWFLIAEDADRNFLHMQPLGNGDAIATRLRNRGVPLKVF